MPTQFPFTIYHLNDFGCIKINGPDSIKFLQGQISINVENLKPTHLNLATMCNPQGRCIAVFFITLVGDSIVFILSKDTIEATIANLKKYAVFFKTTISDASDDYRILGVTANVQALEDEQEDAFDFSYVKFNQGEVGFIIEPASGANEVALADKFDSVESQQEWLFQLAAHKIPWLSAISQGEFLPHNLNLPALNAVDFKKGCFTGQEVIARMHYKGKLKSHLQLFSSEQTLDFPPKTKIICDNGSVGEVICMANSRQGETKVLGLIKDSALDQQKFQLIDENGPILKVTKTN